MGPDVHLHGSLIIHPDRFKEDRQKQMRWISSTIHQYEGITEPTRVSVTKLHQFYSFKAS